MSIWNKVLVGLIIVAVLPYAMLAAKAFKRQQELRQSIDQDRQQLQRLEEENRKLQEGEEGFAGVVDLQVALDRAVLSRGRIWENATATVAADGTTTLAVADPAPHQITTNLTLFAFDAAGEPGFGQFLGEFKVTEVAEAQITLAPALKPTAAQLEKLTAASGRGWTLYELMPVDNQDLYRGAKARGVDLVPAVPEQQQLEALTAQVRLAMPAATPERQAEVAAALARELKKDGQPAEEGDPADRIDPETRTYSRPLLDFATLLHEYERQRTLLLDAIASAELQKQYTEASLADAQQQLKFTEEQKAAAQTRLAAVTRERDAVQTHRQELVAALEKTQTAIENLLAKNRRLAAALAKYQFEAVAEPEAASPAAPAGAAAPTAQAAALP